MLKQTNHTSCSPVMSNLQERLRIISPVVLRHPVRTTSLLAP